MSEWLVWGGRLVRLALLAVALIVLAAVAAATADAIQILAPSLLYGQSCPQQPAWVVIAAPGPGADFCQWDVAVSRSRTRPSISLDVAESSAGRLTATAVVTVPSDDPIAAAIRDGAAEQDAFSFTETIIGGVAINSGPMEWAAPVLSDGPRGEVTITESGAELPTSLGGPGDSAPLTVQIQLSTPGTARVTSAHRVIGAVRGAQSIVSQDARAVVARTAADGPLTVSLVPDAVQPLPGGPSAGELPAWLSRVLSFIWGALSGTFQTFFPALPWLGIFLAARSRAFGTVNLQVPWTRLEWTAGQVLIADLAISAALAISAQESATTAVLASQLSSFPGAMLRAGFWQISGYPQVNGGIVVLIALIVSFASWWGRGPGAPHARLPRNGLAACCMVLAVSAFALLLGTQPVSSQHQFLAAGAEIPISAVLALSCVALAAAAAADAMASPLRLLPLAPSLRHAARSRQARVLILAAVLAVAASLTGAGIVAVFAGRSFAVSLNPFVPAPVTAFSRTWIVVTLLALPVLATAGYTARPWLASRLIPPALLVSLISVLSVAATITIDTGILPVVVRWGVLIVAGSAIGIAVVRLLALALSGAPPPKRYLAAIVPLTIVIAVPWGDLRASPSVISGWWGDILSYASNTQGFLGLVLIAAGCVTLRDLGSAPVFRRDELRAHRRLGIAAWLIVLTGSYTLLGTWDRAAVITLTLGGAGAWLLFPAWQVDPAGIVLGQHPGRQAKAIRQTLRAGARRRLLSAVSKNAQDKVASGDMTIADAEQRMAATQQGSTGAYEQVTIGGGTVRITPQQRGFGMLSSTSPWSRARWGAITGIWVGAPWVILGLAGASFQFGQQSYPELTLLTFIAPLIVRWAAYGFLFGYFYPMLRGRTGLEKAIWVAIAAAAPAVFATLASGQVTERQWEKTALLAVQILAFALTLGILADRAVLRDHGIPATRLVDLHNLWAVSAWISSVAVAVAAGLATAIVVGLQPFVVGVIEPSAPPQQAIVATHQGQSTP
jgi:hypothetical protein